MVIIYVNILLVARILSSSGTFQELEHSPRLLVMDIDTFIVESRRLRSKGTKSLPDMSHQSKEESNYLKLHKCRDGGEAYSASYLITKEHLRYQNTAYNLSWVNCEMGSFIMMNGNANPQKSNINGTIIQSLDVLDFAVVHLSAYERLQRRWGLSVEKSLAAKLPINITNNRKTKAISIPWNISAVTESAELLRAHALKVRRYSSELLSTPQLNRTIVVMPFLGADMGAGHSKLHNRLQYLHACFWSFYAKIPHIVAFVKNDKDYQYARNTSNLPFFDVVLLDNLPKSASLPVSTVQQTKARLMDGRWDFDFIFFTESDQAQHFIIYFYKLMVTLVVVADVPHSRRRL